MPLEFPTWIVVVALTVGVLGFTAFVCWLIVKQVAKSREMSHLEHMKALELGQPVGPSAAEERQNKYLHNAFWMSFWIGAGVPIAAISAASSVVIQTHILEFRIILAIWICVAIISVASVVCATVLMISGRRWSPKQDKDSLDNGKAE